MFVDLNVVTLVTNMSRKSMQKLPPHQPSSTFSPRKTRKPTLLLTASACKSLPLPLVKLGVVTACSTYIHAGKRKGTGRVVVSSPPPPLPLLFSPIFPPFPPRSPSVTVGRPLSSFLLPFSSSWTAEGGLGRTGERRENERPGFSRGIFYTEVRGTLPPLWGTLKTSKMGFWESFLPCGEVNARRGKLLLSPFLAPKRRSKRSTFHFFLCPEMLQRADIKFPVGKINILPFASQ